MEHVFLLIFIQMQLQRMLFYYYIQDIIFYNINSKSNVKYI